ncbi:hypothetical protein GUJ93_ZPchr0007g3260 [Zizania palustris]|uniref:Uncharacterized protein n=1 Tax=Zizania palustris TaxID=103762 RepID=A0A8J5TJ61_ZIZPA|nr:hypothetical protein GUJ93_ZPchr0007g3260 [Zizania palustris]
MHPSAPRLRFLVNSSQSRSRIMHPARPLNAECEEEEAAATQRDDEGVTCMDIATKKVMVVGDVAPLAVLTTVSKVKPV